MLGKLLGLFGRNGEIRILSHDAKSVIADAQGRFPEDRLRLMGTELARHLEDAHEWLERPNMSHQNVLLHFKGQHREARRSQRDLDLSVYTLVIIFLRADALGTDAAQAKTPITEFVQQWAKDPAETQRNQTLEA